MKKIISILYLIVILCTACTSPEKQSSSADNTRGSLQETATIVDSIATEPVLKGSESILSSYYSLKSSPAFKIFKKSIFKNLLDDWIGNDIENPIWNYDSFTQYRSLNHELKNVNSDSRELYYCTFSADNGKYGYIVMIYDGASLEKISMIETPYLYDLQANLDIIVTKLNETQIDLSSAVASRVQLVGTDKNRSDEVILFTDDSGNNYACYLESLKIKKL